MKTTFRILLLITLSLISIDISAQLYRVESLVSDVIFTKDKRAKVIDRSNERGYRIPNGTEIKVLSRVVEDTTNARGILAKIEYNGKYYYTEARWLVFSENNKEGVKNIFANDNFSPAAPELMGLKLTQLDPHSKFGHFLYSYIPPIISASLLLIGIIMLFFNFRPLIPGILFLISSGIQVYLSTMLDWDVFWWCNPDYHELSVSMLRVVLLAIYLIMQFSFIILFYMSGDDKMKIWPIVACYLLVWPAGMLSVYFIGTIWAGTALCYLIPIFINLVNAGIKGAITTIFFFIAISIIFGTFTSMFQISLWLLGEMLIVCPGLAFLLSLVIGPVLENLSEKGRTYGWTSDGKRHIMDDKDNTGNFRYS